MFCMLYDVQSLNIISCLSYFSFAENDYIVP